MLWLFLPFVVILSGVVAYAADTIAKKVGRKHVRWFGLRPKTTALLVAVLSGMGISAASLAAFLGLNRSAVNTIAQADQLRPQIEALRREVGTVQKDLSAVQQERDRARQDAQKLAGERQQALEELQSAQTGLKTAQADLTAARTTQQGLEKKQAALQGRIETLTTLQKKLEAQAQAARQRVSASETALKASQTRAQTLKDQLLTLQTSSAQALLDVQNAQQRSEEAQRRSEEAQLKAQQVAQKAQARAQQAQLSAKQAQAQAEAARQNAQQQISALSDQLALLKQSAQSAQAARDEAAAARDKALTQQKAAQQERDRLVTQRDQLTAQRTQAMQERDRVQASLVTLKKQQAVLQGRNAEIAKQLDTARLALAQLRDDYRTANTELSVSRNVELAYQKNDLVYAGVVPSVRNLDTFLDFTAQAAEAHGAKGNDQGKATRLNSASRAMLETKLRGLNTSSFVLCRATQNSPTGFPVDLSCDARPNTVLFRAGQPIRSAMVTVDGKTTQSQITEIVQDAVLELTSRGVPSDYINNQGLDVSQFASLLSQLNSRSGKVMIAIAARDDVKPASRVDLYAVLP